MKHFPKHIIKYKQQKTNDDNIVFTRANKADKVIAISSKEYVEKINDFIQLSNYKFLTENISQSSIKDWNSFVTT